MHAARSRRCDAIPLSAQQETGRHSVHCSALCGRPDYPQRTPHPQAARTPLSSGMQTSMRGQAKATAPAAQPAPAGARACCCCAALLLLAPCLACLHTDGQASAAAGSSARALQVGASGSVVLPAFACTAVRIKAPNCHLSLLSPFEGGQQDRRHLCRRLGSASSPPACHSSAHGPLCRPPSRACQPHKPTATLSSHNLQHNGRRPDEVQMGAKFGALAVPLAALSVAGSHAAAVSRRSSVAARSAVRAGAKRAPHPALCGTRQIAALADTPAFCPQPAPPGTALELPGLASGCNGRQLQQQALGACRGVFGSRLTGVPAC